MDRAESGMQFVQPDAFQPSHIAARLRQLAHQSGPGWTILIRASDGLLEDTVSVHSYEQVLAFEAEAAAYGCDLLMIDEPYRRCEFLRRPCSSGIGAGTTNSGAA